jgi:type IV pilus assembly protein PilW
MRKMTPYASIARARARQAGFTLVEMMVALTIGLFLVLGFTVAFVNMKGTFVSQDKLSQLQDNERLAMAVLTSTVGQAGYFPVTTANLGATRSGALPADANATYGALAAGQAVIGQVAAAGRSETLSTRYAGNTSDGLLNCVGGNVVISPATSGSVRNVFAVNTATNTLGCVYSTDGGATYVTDTGGQPFALVSNITSMSVQYGVDTDADGNIDTYKAVGSVAAGEWASVKAVRVTLTFINPNAAASPITWVQTINLMNNK